MQMASTLSYVGYILVLIGGIVTILFGLLDLLGISLRVFSILTFIRGAIYDLVDILIGVVCIIGSRRVSNLFWGIILLILGFIAGHIGGALVIVGAILGLLSTLLKSAPR